MSKLSRAFGFALSLSMIGESGYASQIQNGIPGSERSKCDMHIGLVYFASINDSAVALHLSDDSFQSERSESKQSLRAQIEKTVKACSTQSAHKFRVGSLAQRLDQLCEDAVRNFVRASRIYGFALQRTLGAQGRPIQASLIPQLRDTQEAIYPACGWDVNLVKNSFR